MMAARQINHEAGVRGRVVYGEPMARHTSWRVGGPADRYFEPEDIDDLATFLRSLPLEEPLLWIGLGSNLLVRDGGVRGTVIDTVRLARLEWLSDGLLRAEAGVPCPKVARATARAGYTGGEFLCGIPGSIGGALAMNAGAFGGETWSVVERVETMDRRGRVHQHQRTDFQIGYRDVSLPPAEWFVAGWLRVQADPERVGERRIRELLANRAATQPTGQPSCGSVFRNPTGDYAGRLIEACGLKGRRVGSAVVSEKHANFIVTEPGASAADLETLMHELQSAVERQFGVKLIPEVRIVGEVRGAASRR
jgi:UDP-N-acetylmuramate dehydrogenase